MLSYVDRKEVHVAIELEGTDTSYLDFYFNNLYKYKEIIEFTNTFLRCNENAKSARISFNLDKITPNIINVEEGA